MAYFWRTRTWYWMGAATSASSSLPCRLRQPDVRHWAWEIRAGKRDSTKDSLKKRHYLQHQIWFHFNLIKEKAHLYFHGVRDKLAAMEAELLLRWGCTERVGHTFTRLPLGWFCSGSFSEAHWPLLVDCTSAASSSSASEAWNTFTTGAGGWTQAIQAAWVMNEQRV